MRHRKSGRHLNRTSAHRKAMFSNMAASLIEHEVIQTTNVKAKELRRTIEPLITLAKEDSIANRRLAFSRLRSKAAVGKLFSDLGPRYRSRPGGYTRILKAGYRSGDATMVAFIELVGRPRPEYDDDDEIETTSQAPTTEPETLPVTDPAVTLVSDDATTEVSESSEAESETKTEQAESAEAEQAETNEESDEAQVVSADETESADEGTTGSDDSDEAKEQASKPSPEKS